MGGRREGDVMIRPWLDMLRAWHQQYQYKKTMRQIREHMLFFGCDLSDLTDRDIENGRYTIPQLKAIVKTMERIKEERR